MASANTDPGTATHNNNDPAPATTSAAEAAALICIGCPCATVRQIVIDEVNNDLDNFIKTGRAFNLTFAHAVTILQAIQAALGGYGDAEPRELAETVRQFAEKLLSKFLNQLGPSGGEPIPEVLRGGPVAVLQALQGLFDLLGQLGRLQGIDDRLALVSHSLNQLLAPQGGGTPFQQDQFLGVALNQLLHLPADIRAGADPSTLVEGILRGGL